jgi:nucleoid-associated protein YgaU
MASQQDISAALQSAGASVFGLQVQGKTVRGTVASGEARFKAVSAIQQAMPDAQVDIQVDERFGKMDDGGAGRKYTVKAGDSLSKIAKEVYGDASQWKKIADANKATVPNPDLIHPGDELTIPA